MSYYSKTEEYSIKQEGGITYDEVNVQVTFGNQGDDEEDKKDDPASSSSAPVSPAGGWDDFQNQRPHIVLVQQNGRSR